MPCTRCRTRHYRCDGQQPTCGRCQQAEKVCVYETGRRFRRSSIQESFSGRQHWVPTPPQLTFIDNSEEARGQSYVDDISRPDFSPSISETTNTLTFPSPPHSGFGSEHGNHVQTSPSSLIGPTEGLSVGSLLNFEPVTRYPSTSAPSSSYGQNTPPNVYRQAHQNVYGPQQAALPYQGALPQQGAQSKEENRHQWPLKQELEAELLRHYVDKVSLFFDMIDDQRHFGKEVVQLSRSNSTLFNAILAVSARHKHLTETGYSKHYGFEYYDPCLKELKGKDVRSYDNATRAAIVILRLYEEMSILVLGQDEEGQFRMLDLMKQTSPTDDLGKAIFLAAFRQQLWMSLTQGCSFNLQMPSFVQQTGSDSVWAAQAIGHVGEVCSFVFECQAEMEKGSFSPEYARPRYEELLTKNRTWRADVPPSFAPYYVKEHGHGTKFPDIRLHEFPHVMGKQYNKLAQVLLVMNEPKIYANDYQGHAGARTLVQDYVRELVGIALSNKKAFPAKLVACYAIAQARDHFTDYEDQRMIENMLIDTEREHGFPTRIPRDKPWGRSR